MSERSQSVQIEAENASVEILKQKNSSTNYITEMEIWGKLNQSILMTALHRPGKKKSWAELYKSSSAQHSQIPTYWGCPRVVAV